MTRLLTDNHLGQSTLIEICLERLATKKVIPNRHSRETRFERPNTHHSASYPRIYGSSYTISLTFISSSSSSWVSSPSLVSRIPVFQLFRSL